ncbi:MAG TPA: helix-turn-helix domain-containing protein, partial [Solirubrobacterales bacterium]|nr:helix-turn-helix domain-containing protein [Solirubrobacterales bacterium]
AKAMSHPLRAHILAELNKRVMSPRRFSERFDVPLGKTAYHFRELEKADCAEVVNKKLRGNRTEHFYRATKRALFDAEAWEKLPETVRNKLSGRTISDFLAATAEAMVEETFDARLDRHAAWGTDHLDERGWEELNDAYQDMVRKIRQISKKSHSRLIRSGERGLMATWALFLFESPFEKPD